MAHPFTDAVHEDLEPCKYKPVPDYITLDCPKCPRFVSAIKKLEAEISKLKGENENLQTELKIQKTAHLRQIRDFEATLKINRAHFRQIRVQSDQILREFLPKVDKILSRHEGTQ